MALLLKLSVNSFVMHYKAVQLILLLRYLAAVLLFLTLQLFDLAEAATFVCVAVLHTNQFGNLPSEVRDLFVLCGRSVLSAPLIDFKHKSVLQVVSF